MVNQVDALLSRIGNGKWNLFHYVSVSIASGLLAPFAMAGAFVVPRLRHICRQPFNTDDTEGIHTNVSEMNSCSYLARTPEGNFQEEPCTAWDYDNSTFTRTITSDFDLVCQREYIRVLYTSVYMLGVLVASPSIGYVSDRFGRKRTFVTGMISLIFLSHISGWLPNIPSLLVCRFLIGMTHVPVTKIAFIIGMETCSPEVRSIAGIFLYLPWALFTIAFGGLAYLERDWRWLLTYSSFISLSLIPALWFLDESPHWLAVRGQYGRALQVLKKAARWNKVTLPPDEEILYLLKDHSAVASKTKGIEDNQSCVPILKENVKNIFILFRTPRLRIISSVMHISFFAIGMVYYGLSFSGGSFKIDIFSYMALCGLTEIPGATVMSPIVARVGRKKSYILGLLSTGIVLLCLTFVPSDYQWVAVTLALLGRTTICVASSVIYLYASELFPTEVRTRGITYSFMMSRVGSAIAPFITEYLAYSYQWAPSIVFGGTAVVAGLASMALPETLGTTLPDTIAFLEGNAPKPNMKGNFNGKQSNHKLSNLDIKEPIPEEKIQLKEDPEIQC